MWTAGGPSRVDFTPQFVTPVNHAPKIGRGGFQEESQAIQLCPARDGSRRFAPASMLRAPRPPGAEQPSAPCAGHAVALGQSLCPSHPPHGSQRPEGEPGDAAGCERGCVGKHTAGFSVPWGFGMHPHPRVRGCGCSHLPVCDGELWTSPPRAPRARGDPRPASSRGTAPCPTPSASPLTPVEAAPSEHVTAPCLHF